MKEILSIATRSMKVGLPVLVVLGLGSGSLAAQSTPVNINPATRFIAVEQNGKVLPEKDGEVVLDRAPFSLFVAMPSSMRVLTRVSRERRLFDAARASDALTAPFGEGGGFVEGLRNGDEQIFVMDSEERGYHYWFYDSPTKHRFDAVKLVEKGVIGKRTVSYYKVMDQVTEGVQSIRDFPGDSLYLVSRLMAGPNTEIARAALKLTFIKDTTSTATAAGRGSR